MDRNENPPSPNPTPGPSDYLLESIKMGMEVKAAMSSPVTEAHKTEATDPIGLRLLHIGHAKEIRETLKQAESGVGNLICHSVCYTLKPTAPVELCPKNQVKLADLLNDYMGTPAFGKYFLCRTVVWPFREIGIHLVVEDAVSDNPRAIILTLNNYILDEGVIFDPYSIPIGTTLLIKNPWLKVASTHLLNIRVDNPTEVEITGKEFEPIWSALPPLNLHTNKLMKEDIPRRPKSYKDLGKHHFSRQEYFAAITCYTNALQRNEGGQSKIPLLLSNRALCYLRTGRPEYALEDLEKVLLSDPENKKGVYQKAVGLARLNKHDEAIKFLQSHPKLAEKDPDISKLLPLLIRYNEAGKSGIGFYDFIFATENVPCQHLNYKEYIGPVKVVPIPGKGRGLVTTKRVNPHQLIMACRAFDILPAEANTKEVNVNLNIEDDKLRRPAFVRLFASIAHRLKDNPAKRYELFQLYAGPKFTSIDPKTVGSGAGAMNVKNVPLVDMGRIEGILEYNGFGHGDFQQFDENMVWSGIWIKPSFINHACVGFNVNVFARGDFLFVTSNTVIPKGTELLMSYFETEKMSYQDRVNRLGRYGFTCGCRICRFERAEEQCECRS